MFANLINVISSGMHILIAAYIVFGWAISPVIHAPICVAVIVHWLLNKNRCIMSEGFEDENGFSSGLLSRIGIDISHSETLKTIVPYILVLIPAAVSVVMAIKGVELVPQIVQSVMSYAMMLVPFSLIGKKLVGAGYKGIVEGLAAADAAGAGAGAVTGATAASTAPATAEESAA
jgi:hypothetical protein